MAAPTDRTPNRLREHRVRLELTQGQVAERLMALATERGIGEIALDQHAVSRHERGRHRPVRRYRTLYGDLYQADERDLWPHHVPAGYDPILCAPWHHTGTVEAATAFCNATATGGDPMHRRSFIVLAGATATAPAHQWLVQEPGRVLAALGGDRVTPTLLTHLRDMITTLRRMDDLHGPQIVLDLAERHAGFVTGLLRNATYTDTASRALHVDLAELGQIAGDAAHDAGHLGRSQRWYLTALRAAHTADDPALGAHVLLAATSLAIGVGQLDDAAALIDTALAGSRGSIGANQLAHLSIWQAKVYALRGDLTQTTRSITTARDAVEYFDPITNPTWLYYFGTPDVALRSGEAMIDAGRPTDAEALLTEGIAALAPDRHLGDQQQFALKLATAQAANHNLDAAVHTGHRALDLYERRPSSRVAQAITTFCATLPTTTGTRDLTSRATTLTATGA
jgi:hypothetical protein